MQASEFVAGILIEFCITTCSSQSLQMKKISMAPIWGEEKFEKNETDEKDEEGKRSFAAEACVNMKVGSGGVSNIHANRKGNGKKTETQIVAINEKCKSTK